MVRASSSRASMAAAPWSGVVGGVVQRVVGVKGRGGPVLVGDVFVGGVQFSGDVGAAPGVPGGGVLLAVVDG